MFGLGKSRTRFGKWLDKEGIKQGELPVNKNTASRLCNDLDYEPYEDTIITVISFLRKKGYDVTVEDFW
ncbi:transcriptional regulator [Paenibacillus sp. GCM10023248]|uniref:transcriptional regulator n=1 Tax=unclassified Paenibacillus TaxID=185978 RepID=UPI0023780723|nr:transcriptional regulator [Paenibacillus sp. MAHUQ-63]MDD9266030.1 transcriptional regulator [Paenibacillus sp. MAHUQ-63]